MRVILIVRLALAICFCTTLSSVVSAQPGFLVMPPQNTENEPQPLREMCLSPSSWPTGWQRMTMFGNAINWFPAWTSDTEIQNCFANLRNAGKELAIEINVVDESFSTADPSYQWWRAQLLRLAGMWGNNATMTLVLDEPLTLGTPHGCSYSCAVTETGRYIQLARQDFPGIKINLEEAYPHWPWQTLANFYGDVNDQARNLTGVGIQYASIDYDSNDPSASIGDMAPLQNMINNVFGFGFHILFVAPPPSGLSWHDALMREGLQFRPWRSQGVNPQLYSIQAFNGGCCGSVNYDPEYQFPENDPGSFSRGVRDFSLAFLPIPSLAPGSYLYPNQSVSSADGRFVLVYQGSDGNLVLYNTQSSPWTPLWSTGASGTPAGFVAMQTDGNLVVYDGTGTAQWWSGTDGNPNAFVVVQSDGNLVVYSGYPSNNPLWETGTNQY